MLLFGCLDCIHGWRRHWTADSLPLEKEKETISPVSPRNASVHIYIIIALNLGESEEQT